MDKFVIIRNKGEDDIIDLTYKPADPPVKEKNKKKRKRNEDGDKPKRQRKKKKNEEDDTTNEEPVGSPVAKAPRPRIGKLTGIDPGPVSMCACQIDISTGNIVKIRHMPLRDKNEKVTVSVLLDRLKKMVEEDKHDLFKEATLVAVEDQRESLRLGSPQFTYWNEAIQHGLQALLGAEKCLLVNAGSVKAHFRKHFPVDKELSSAQRYWTHKKNAIKAGKATTTNREQSRIVVPNEHLKDAYDSLWIARYACDVEFPSGSEMWYQ